MKKDIVKYPVYEKRMVNLLKSNGKSIAGIAKEIGVGATTLRRQLKAGRVNKDILQSIAKALDVPAEQLYTIVCFSSRQALQKLIGKWTIEYLENYDS